MKSQSRKKKKNRLSRVTQNKTTRSLPKMISLRRSLLTLKSRICGLWAAVVDPISQITSSGLQELCLERFLATTCSSQGLPAKRSPTKNLSTITWPRTIFRSLLSARTKLTALLNTERKLKQSRVGTCIWSYLKLKTSYTSSTWHNVR